MADNAKFSYMTYDEAGRELDVVLTLPSSTHFTEWDEFKGFAASLDNYHGAHVELVKTINTEPASAANNSPQTLAALLFPNQESIKEKEDQFNRHTTNHFQAVSALANRAARVRKGKFLGFGKNESAYAAVTTLLKQLGEYIESKIINTPWHMPIAKENYLLVALKDSPETFAEAQKSKNIDAYIEELNAAKRDHAKIVLENNTAIFIQEVARYVKRVEAVGKKFHNLGNSYLAQIKKIEKVRQSRWKITNILKDIFNGDERKQLDGLKNELKIAETLEKSYKQLAEGTKPLVDHSIFMRLSSKFLQDINNVTAPELNELRTAVIALLKLNGYKRKITDFIAQLQTAVSQNIEKIGSPASNNALPKQLEFLALNEITDASELNNVHTTIVNKIKEKLEEFDSPADGLAYAAKWEQLDETVKTFDISLFQNMQNKKSQYQSWKLLSETWDKLLDDKAAQQLSTENINDFITAILWLDKSNADTSNGLIEKLKELTPFKRDQLQQAAKEKLASLKEKIISDDLANIAKCSLTTEKSAALKHRLKFITQANAQYTNALGDLRQEVIGSISDHLAKQVSVSELKRYLVDLDSVLPPELINDPDLSAAIKNAKNTLVKQHFSQEQKKLHEKYQQELAFLRTGNLTLWNTIKSTFKDGQSQALTEDNIQHWQKNFLHQYATTLDCQAKIAVDFAKYDPKKNAHELETLHEFLQQSIRDDYKTIAMPLTLDLIELADLRRKAALDKLDKILGLESAKPVDINMFMLRYLAVAEYQRYYSENSTLVQSGREFVRKFHDIAQHEGGFTTQIIAKLPIEALAAMHSTWSRNPEVSLSEDSELHLTADIVGEVDANHDTHIQLPQYLLLNMVSELIVADFDALLRGEDVDMKLLNDRIKFAIPKLQQQMAYENKLNGNSGITISSALLNSLQNLNTNLTIQYEKLVTKLLPKDVVETNSLGIVTNLSRCKELLLEQLKTSIKDQIDIITGVNESDFSYAAEEKIIKDTDDTIKLFKTQLDTLPKTSFASDKESAEKESHIQQSIENMEKRKEEQPNKIAEKKAKTAWIKEIQGSISQTLPLLANDRITLDNFLSKIDTNILELLEPSLAATSLALKQKVAMKGLLTDETFHKARLQLIRDLQDGSKNILDIIRDFPESITRELPEKTADMIRQLQYRFADRFNGLMVKMLDNNHLSLVDKDIDNFSSQAKNITPEKTPNWVNPFKFFVAKISEQKSAVVDSKETARDRLQKLFNNLDSDAVKELLNQLSSTAKSNKVSLEHLYESIGSSAPMPIR